VKAQDDLPDQVKRRVEFADPLHAHGIFPFPRSLFDAPEARRIFCRSPS
jgi:hypothetical protein